MINGRATQYVRRSDAFGNALGSPKGAPTNITTGIRARDWVESARMTSAALGAHVRVLRVFLPTPSAGFFVHPCAGMGGEK